MLCFVTIISILLNLLCVWILIRNASSHSCFRVDLVSTHMPGQGGFSLCPHDKTAVSDEGKCSKWGGLTLS